MLQMYKHRELELGTAAKAFIWYEAYPGSILELHD